MPHFERQSELEQMLRACYHEFGLFRHPDPGPDPQNLLAPILTRMGVIQDTLEQVSGNFDDQAQQLKQLENYLMTTLAEFQTQMDAVKQAVNDETNLVTAVKTALDGATASIANLQAQIAALQAAGAGAVTQDQLDALAQEATDTLTVQTQNNAALAALAPQNTTPPAAPPST
jgi:predicted transcriptional regulator